MKYIHLSFSLPSPLPLREKQEFASKFFMGPFVYNKTEKFQKGFIRKFSNALGYRLLDDEFNGDGSLVVASTPSPEGFESPYALLSDTAITPMDGLTVVEFYVPMKTFVHSDSRYSYRTSDLIDQFEKFVNKVLPDLKSSVQIVDQVPSIPSIDFVKNFFYISLRDHLVTIEASLKELLPEEDILSILDPLQQLTKHPIGIEQAACEVCKSNTGGTHPYHIEIVYMGWNNGTDPSTDDSRSSMSDNLNYIS